MRIGYWSNTTIDGDPTIIRATHRRDAPRILHLLGNPAWQRVVTTRVPHRNVLFPSFLRHDSEPLAHPHPRLAPPLLHLAMSGLVFAVGRGPTCPPPHLRLLGDSTTSSSPPALGCSATPPKTTRGFNFSRAASRRDLRRLRFFCARVRISLTAIRILPTTWWRGAALCIFLANKVSLGPPL